MHGMAQGWDDGNYTNNNCASNSALKKITSGLAGIHFRRGINIGS